MREDIVRQVEAARTQIELQLAALMALPNRDELAEQINALQSQISQLDGMLAQAASGNLVQLSSLQVGLAQSVGSVLATSTALTSVAGGNAYQSVMLMSHDQMRIRQQEFIAESAQFQSYEAGAFGRIDELAALNGVDASRFHEVREALQAEYAAAEAEGDLVGMAEADALGATNLRRALEATGASEAEIRQALAEESAREEAYYEQVAIHARIEGEAQGLSGEVLEDHVAGAVVQAETNLEERRAGMEAEWDAIGLDMIPLGVEGETFEVAEVAEAAAPLTTPSDPHVSAEMQI